MGAVSHSIVQTALKACGSHRLAAYDAAAQIADLANPDLGGLYDEDAAAIAATLPTILTGAYIPGQLTELFTIAAKIADRVADGEAENIETALQEVAMETLRKDVRPPYA